jgi:capsid protein
MTARGKYEFSEWYRVEWQGPQEIQLDRQQDNQADMLEWQMGLGTMSKFAKRRGGDLEDMLTEKAKNLQLAAKIEAKYGLDKGKLIQTQIPGQTDPGAQAAKPAPAAKDDEVAK